MPAVFVCLEPAGLDGIPFFFIQRRGRENQRPIEAVHEEAAFEVVMDVEHAPVVQHEIDFVVGCDIEHHAVDHVKALAVFEGLPPFFSLRIDPVDDVEQDPLSEVHRKKSSLREFRSKTSYTFRSGSPNTPGNLPNTPP